MARLKFTRSLLILIIGMYQITNAQVPSTSQHLWSIITTDTSSNYTPAYLANGIVSLRPERDGLSVSSVHINGLYDSSPDNDSVRMVSELNPLNIKILFNNGQELTFGKSISNWQQVLNLKEATLETSYSYNGVLNVNTKLLALRNLPAATMGIYEFVGKEDVEFTVQNTVAMPNRSTSLPMFTPAMNFKNYKFGAYSPIILPIMSCRFPTESGTDAVAGANTYFFDGKTPNLNYSKIDNHTQQLSFSVKLKKGDRFSFCMVSNFQHTNFSSDPLNDVIRLCSREYNLGYKHKLEEHKRQWADLWKSDIEIEGDDEAQLLIRHGIYNTVSSITEGLELSIPPCGITNEWGAHIFWDAELWIFAPLAVLHPELGRSMVDFRYNTLDAAKKRAVQFGFKGAMYPWESDLKGNENTRLKWKLDMNEYHITPDISITAFNFYRLSQDGQWLKEKGYPIIKGVADFCTSLARVDADGKYHINNITGPDEHYDNVNDDAFTNTAVKVALDNAIKSAKLLGEKINSSWITVRDNIVVLKHKDGYTLQNEEYDGRMIKQADVNLIAFPLNAMADKDQILKDLIFYEPKIKPTGPTMSFSAMAGGYAHIGKIDKAYELFLKAYKPNVKPPFNMLCETRINQVSPFLTGWGGLIQTVLFGFGGLKMTDKGLVQTTPNLPGHWKKLAVKVKGQKDIVLVKNK